MYDVWCNRKVLWETLGTCTIIVHSTDSCVHAYNKKRECRIVIHASVLYGSNLVLYLIILLFSIMDVNVGWRCDVCMLKTPSITGLE